MVKLHNDNRAHYIVVRFFLYKVLTLLKIIKNNHKEIWIVHLRGIHLCSHNAHTNNVLPQT